MSQNLRTALWLPTGDADPGAVVITNTALPDKAFKTSFVYDPDAPGGLAAIATSGDYSDLVNPPTLLPTATQIGVLSVYDDFEDVRTSNTGGVAALSVSVYLRGFEDTVPAYHVVHYKRDDNYTEATAAITSLDGYTYIPLGQPNVLHFQAMGLKSRDNGVNAGYLLEDQFATLGEAQAVFPKALSLSETMDAAATQKMIDFYRYSPVYSSGDIIPARQVMTNTSFHYPRGVYVINKSIDATSIRTGHAFIPFTGDGTIILCQSVGTVTFDLTDSRKFAFQNIGFIGDWIPGQGVCRAAIFLGRGDINGGRSSDSHTFLNVEFDGRWSLAAIHNFASEDVRFLTLSIKNKLDNRRHYFSYSGSDASAFTTGEEITWTGGGVGSMQRAEPPGGGATGYMCVRVTSGTLADGTVITGTTSGKTATVGADILNEPDGEAPRGRSYCMVQDGSNYWGTYGTYFPAHPQHVASSFLRNCGLLDFRHTGHGDAMWISRGLDHDYTGSYFVSDDEDEGAAIVIFENVPGDNCSGLKLDCHIETDLGDEDADTGIQYEVVFDAKTPGTDCYIEQFVHRRNKAQIGQATFTTTANVNSVFMDAVDISIAKVGRYDGQVLFKTPGKFTVVGNVEVLEDVNTDFINIDEIAKIGGQLWVANRLIPGAINTASSYKITDLNGSLTVGTNNNLVDLSGYSYLRAVNTSGTQQAQLRLSSTSMSFFLSSGTPEYQMTAGGFYPFEAASTKSVGRAANPFKNVYATEYYDGNGVRLLREQAAAISDVVVTYTTGTPPSNNPNVTVADAANPTPQELLRLHAATYQRLLLLTNTLRNFHRLLAQNP